MDGVKLKRWVLIADEDEVFRKNMSDLLVSHFGKDIKIVEASDGLAAITKINNQTFHLIITGWHLPKRSGQDLIEAVRGNPFNNTTPLIVTSDTAQSELEKQFEFVNFIKKPIDPYGFVQIVRNLFSLGSTEKMISASIFASLLDSSLVFLREALSRNDFELNQMAKKPKGQVVHGDHAAIITVQIGKVSNTFSVLCDEATLTSLRDSSEKIEGSSLHVICRSLGFVILKHVLTECGIINHNEVTAHDISQDPNLLTEKNGIIAPIVASGIEYKIFATTHEST